MSYNEADLDKEKHANDPNIEARNGSIAERLKALANGRGARELAPIWNMSASTINSYVLRGSIPSLDRALSIAIAEGVDLNWLATGESLGEIETRPMKSTPHQALSIRNVEKFNVAASAGGGSYIEEESVEEYYPFSDEFLKRNRLSHAELLIVEAKGDSMAPYIESGDDLLLKRVEFNADKALSGVHVISIDGHLKVKRLEYSIQRNGYRIISDNPEYPEEFINHEELMQDRMRVIGEVVMVMGRPSQPASQPAKD
ncbi:LexA family transcriptional regulator [Vibrio parahaemolyticus]